MQLHEQSLIGQPSHPTRSWQLWLCWIVVSLVAWVIAVLANQLLKESDIALLSFVSLIVGGAVGAAILSTAQWFILRPLIRAPGWWIGGSILAGAFGVIAGIIISAGLTIFSVLVISAVTPYEPPTGPDLTPIPVVSYINLLFALGGAVGGAVVGGVQVLCLRRPIRHRRWWVGAWSLGAAAGNFLLLPIVMGPVVNGLISGLAYGIITAPALMLLRRNLGAHRIATQQSST